jgi:3-methyladenine DNA glycosylase AlkD
MLSLLILVKKFAKSDETGKEEIFDFYTKNTEQINNWDLVDLSAPHIVGSFLLERDRELLFSFACSESLWKKRISMISTLTFIRLRDYDTTFAIAEILLNDKHDLIQKAVGWMLREVGKRDIDAELMFLNVHYKKMPRTMLRYAIEKFHEPLRLSYLKGEA